MFFEEVALSCNGLKKVVFEVVGTAAFLWVNGIAMKTAEVEAIELVGSMPAFLWLCCVVLGDG
ncbi:hypothetical protein D3Z30_13325 [Staphylococcus warneri]|uniref:Uncharacterized protein n=1 Tax=Staphylococcus warneri TaxID=1292 RepID=A0AB36BKI3_STAWA|nr:hypothetical protein [Staphylococcus warneri]